VHCFQPGTRIQGRYELQAEVGVGGLGAVWSARHLGLDQDVALKFLKPDLADHPEAVTRFGTEARACFVLRSEHVVRVLDVDSHAGLPFIVMELLEGTDLRRVLDAQAALDPAIVVDYALQVCEGLCAAHASGVVHRDIKPENLFLHGSAADACIKLLDFGISQVETAYEQDPLLSRLDAVAAAGTPPYMSPEQLRGLAVDARSDVWSLGCVLYELLTGTAPFERGTLQESCAAVLALEPPPITTLREALSPELSEVVACCLRKDPAERYGDAAQLAAALVELGTGRFADYPARCYAQLRGERRSGPELLVALQPTAALDWAAWKHVSSLQQAWSLAQLLLVHIQRSLRTLSVRNAWLVVVAVGALCMLSWVHAQRAEEPHIVTPSAPLSKPKHADTAALVHSDALPLGAAAALEQGTAEPKVLEQTSKRRSRHGRGGRYRYHRRHAQREPDVGF
jgi:hypothetical protein